MLNKKFFQKLKENYKTSEIERRKIISYSNPALHNSKRAIFAMHRGDIKRGEELLSEVENSLIRSQKSFGFARLSLEGSYKASVEEYVEAKMFYHYIKGKRLTSIPKIKISHESYLGGMCDLTGELVRLAVNKASRGEIDEVKKLKGVINDIIGELIEFDMVGYMRTKFDQAKGNLRKIEQINYEIKIRDN